MNDGAFIGDPLGQQLAVGYGDGAWSDLAPGAVEMTGRIERAVYLPFGTQKASPTVEILVRTETGLLVHANTTWALWDQTTKLFNMWHQTR